MLTLTAETREIFGKRVKDLREEGLIPAELYGRGKDNVHLAVPAKEFGKLFKEAGENTVLELVTDQGSRNVLVYGTQENPLTGEVRHIDFYEVRMDEKITASIPLHFVGESAGVKELNGVLVKAVQELEVEALPADLPQTIEVNLEMLPEIGSSVHVKDLKIDSKVEILVDPETVVATVVPQAVEEEVVGPASVEEVKVEGEEERKAAEAAKAEEEGKQ